MSDETQVTASLAQPTVRSVAAPIDAPQYEVASTQLDDELEAIAEGLERIVDQRRQPLRRVFDVMVACGALIVLAPVMLLVALAIRLDSPGPVFYTQQRIGLHRRRGERRKSGRSDRGRRVVVSAGRPFKIWKFRTMRPNAESNGPQWAQTNDPRITRVGRFLRRTRLDEIPQFINVLKGDMSVIGPRPERSFFIKMLESEVPQFPKRLLVKPGITGYAQVHNGYDDSVESVRRKVAWDLRYIRSQGPKSDLEILAKTVRTILTGEGAC